MNGSPNQDEALAVIALNVLTGKIDPGQWRGLSKVDEDDEAVLNSFRKIRQWGYGRLEVTVAASRIDTLYESKTFKRKDLIP